MKLLLNKDLRVQLQQQRAVTVSIPKQRVLFQHKRADITYDSPDLSSDAGVLLLKALDQRLGLCEAVAALLPDERRQSHVIHSRFEQTQQSIFQLCLGYEDTNDADKLRLDPALQYCLGLSPASDEALSSQATLCRFESVFDAVVVVALRELIEDRFVAALPRKTLSIVLDVDGTWDPAHGGQQFAMFNGHYHGHGFLPLCIFDAHGRLASLKLRPGNVHDSTDALPLLTSIITRLRERFPNIRVLVRGDAAFSMPVLMDGLEALSTGHSRIDYLFGLKSNAVLARHTRDKRERMKHWKVQPGTIRRSFLSFDYKANSWPHSRRVVARLQVNDDGAVKARHVITTLKHRGKRDLYIKDYAQRGQAENYIKDFKRGLLSDRLSCEKFVTNHGRLLMHGIAYILMFRLREALRRVAPSKKRMELASLRLKYLKIACSVQEFSRRVWIRLPECFPGAQTFSRLLEHLHGATTS